MNSLENPPLNAATVTITKPRQTNKSHFVGVDDGFSRFGSLARGGGVALGELNEVFWGFLLDDFDITGKLHGSLVNKIHSLFHSQVG